MNQDKDISENNDHQLMMQYLEGKLLGKDLHEFEKKMASSNLLNDAVEGLQTIESKTNIDVYVADLNKQLQNYTSSKKKRRLKNRFQLNDWTLLSILLIITLAIVAFWVIKVIIK